MSVLWRCKLSEPNGDPAGGADPLNVPEENDGGARAVVSRARCGYCGKFLAKGEKHCHQYPMSRA